MPNSNTTRDGTRLERIERRLDLVELPTYNNGPSEPRPTGPAQSGHSS